MDLAFFKPKFFKPAKIKISVKSENRRKGVSMDKTSQTSLANKFNPKIYENNIRPKSAYLKVNSKINHLIKHYSKSIDKQIFGEIPEFYSVDSNIRQKYEVISEMENSKYISEITSIEDKLRKEKTAKVIKFNDEHFEKHSYVPQKPIKKVLKY